MARRVVVSRFAPNIDNRGRIVRLGGGVLLLAGAWFARDVSWWLAGSLAAGAVFAFFEALRGWCILRACSLKTPV